MNKKNQLKRYRRHLEERYNSLVQRATDYKYIDECKSDRSAFKAMKVLEKINRVRYLNQELSDSAI